MKPENRKRPHRATSEIPIILDERFYSDLEKTVLKVHWPYKSEHGTTFVMRDRALVSFLIATGLRISEALTVKIEQFRDYKNKLVVFNVPTLKNGRVRKESALALLEHFYLFAPFLFRGFPPQPLPGCPLPLPEPSFFGTPFGIFTPPSLFLGPMELLLFYTLSKSAFEN